MPHLVGLYSQLHAKGLDVIDRLEEARFVERRRSTKDRRVVRVRATRAGMAKAKSMIGPLAELYDAQLGHLSAKQLDTTNNLMVRARKSG